MSDVTTPQTAAASFILAALEHQYPGALPQADSAERTTLEALALQLASQLSLTPAVAESPAADNPMLAAPLAMEAIATPAEPLADPEPAPIEVMNLPDATLDAAPAVPVTPEVAPGEPVPPSLEKNLPREDTPMRPGDIPRVTLAATPTLPPRLRVHIERNARAGEPYQATLSATTLQGEPVAILSCEVPEDAGIQFTDGTLKGDTPVEGEHHLHLHCEVPGFSQNPVAVTAVLLVNPDPRSLWKNLPSDRDAPGWKTDSFSSFQLGAGGRRLVAASQRGRSHAHNGGFRDDDVALRVTAADGWNILAVADGAGSAKRSRIGSRVAVDTAVEIVANQLAKPEIIWPLAELTKTEGSIDLARGPAYQVLGTAAFEAVKAIFARAQAQESNPRDYATTLLLAIHRSLGTHDLVASFWVGDGAIGLMGAPGELQLLGQPDGGEFAGQTRFLDREAVADGATINRRIHLALVPRFEALLLMTDGVSDPYFPSDTALGEAAAWQRLWGEISPLLAEPDASQRLLDWLGFWSSGNHDDRTIAVLW